jgi:hypothetical protein
VTAPYYLSGLLTYSCGHHLHGHSTWTVQAASREILAGLDRLQEVLEKGGVAEVKAVLRAYIGRVEYDHEKNRARVGFLRLPTRALVSRLASESARISVVAGARYVPLHIRAAFWQKFQFAA